MNKNWTYRNRKREILRNNPASDKNWGKEGEKEAKLQRKEKKIRNKLKKINKVLSFLQIFWSNSSPWYLLAFGMPMDTRSGFLLQGCYGISAQNWNVKPLCSSAAHLRELFNHCCFPQWTGLSVFKCKNLSNQHGLVLIFNQDPQVRCNRQKTYTRLDLAFCLVNLSIYFVIIIYQLSKQKI